jgi:hypothetical protein
MFISKLTVSSLSLSLVITIVFSTVSPANNSNFYESVLNQAEGKQKEFLADIIENKSSFDKCYDLLKRQLIDGNYADVDVALEMQDANGALIFQGRQFALLRAQSAGINFILYSRIAGSTGWPSEEEGAELRRLAQKVTASYEEAFKLAESDFQKACIYARWHEFHTMNRFEADSQLLRSGSPLEYQNRPVDAKLSSQVSQLRSAAENALDSVANNVNKFDKLAFLDVFTQEYAKLGKIGVPDEIFSEIIEDIPVFLQKAISPVVLIDPQKNSFTLQYYLWYALTGPRPDKVEKEYISKQVDTVNQMLKEKLAKNAPEYEDTASKNFLELVALEAGNRFIPRFKQPIWPYEWSQARNSSAKSIKDNILERLDSNIKRISEEVVRLNSRRSSVTSTAAGIDREMQLSKNQTITSLSATLVFEMATFQRLQIYHQLPSMNLTSSGGTANSQSGIWVFSVDKAQSVPPYPWKKEITPVDSTMSGTRDIAQRILGALKASDNNTIKTLISESRDFTKKDVIKLIELLKKDTLTNMSWIIQDIYLEKPWSWSAVKVNLSMGQTTRNMVLIVHWKDRAYWLAWAGILDEMQSQQATLANIVQEHKTNLELPPEPEKETIIPPADIALVDDVGKIKSLKPLNAGYSWQVQLAIVPVEGVISGFSDANQVSMSKMLYCRAEWTDANGTAKAIPFGRYSGRLLGPVLWSISSDGFREERLTVSSNKTPPLSIQGNGSIYASILPGGTGDLYVQVYSAFTGRELARQQIKATQTTTAVWGQFIEKQKGKPYSVSADFVAANPGMPAFRPIQDSNVAITLSLEDGLFVLKSDKRVLPASGKRLLARWWLNGKSVYPKAAEKYTYSQDTELEGLAGVLRLPATLPAAVSNAKPDDKIELQVMLSPECLESPLVSNQGEPNTFVSDKSFLPSVPLISNRIRFKVDTAMLTKRNAKAATTASISKLIGAIEEQDIKSVRKLVAESPDLVQCPNSSGQTALGYLCNFRPQPRSIMGLRIGGGSVDEQYWRDMTKIAEILIDYGADINVKEPSGRTPIQTLLSREESRFNGDASPVELVRLLLERGANLESIDRANVNGTVLQHVVGIIQSTNSKRLIPVVKMLLEYDADVFGTSAPWKTEPVFSMIDSIKQRGNPELAGLILKYGEKRRSILEQRVTLGVAEFLSAIRNAGEKELQSLNDKLPGQRGNEWLQVGRQFQKEFGSALRGIGKTDKIILSGSWAEALLPTGGQGDLSYLRLTLMRYPGGDYHVVEALIGNNADAGRTIRSAELSYRGLMNAVFCAFGRLDMCQTSGSAGSGYPDRIELLSISNEKGRLVAKGMNLPSWTYFRAELISNLVFYWDNVWGLNLPQTMNFTTENRQLIMEKGTITAKNADKEVVFKISGDKVSMNKDNSILSSQRFILNLKTLEVNNNQANSELSD